MTNEEFDRLLKSASGRVLGVTDADRHRYVDEPDATPDEVRDNNGLYPSFPPTVPVTDEMRSPLPARHEIELWHDTTMWNEGFENARDAIVTVAVSTDADRDDLVAWVAANYELMSPSRNGRASDQIFFTRVHAAYPDAEALTLDGAKQVFQTTVDAWGGI